MGIGTANPATKLVVDNSANAATAAVTINSQSGQFSQILLNVNSGSQKCDHTRPATNTLVLHNNGADRIHIDGTGKVGIGTATPAAMLHVQAANTTDTGGQLRLSSSGTDFWTIGSRSDSDVFVFNRNGLGTTAFINSNGVFTDFSDRRLKN